MGIIDEIKERLDIVEFIGQYVPLKKAGRNYQALCPFHTERTPSFIVFPDRQNWHCFGACGTGGDIFSFVMRRENMDFSEAVRYLAQRAGIALLPRSEEEAAASRAKKLLLEINEEAAAYFHRLLLESADGERARRYLARRGIEKETIARFQLGYALDDWHALERHLTSKGYHVPDIVAAGLLAEQEDGGQHDRFRGRLMFSIRNMQGHVVGFGGRVLDEGLPKYLNSPQTPLFDKSSVLYGIDLAREAIRSEGLAIIVEGYMDVLMAHQHGLKNVVASLGTALTEGQLKTLKRLTKKLALALDSDAAGDRGTLRGLETARQVMDRQVVPVPTWKGYITYETQLDAEIKIITLPPGKDPDEIIRDSPEAWAGLVKEALPVVEYYFRALTADLDLQSPKGKAEAVSRLRPIIAEIGSSAERAHYMQELARLVKMSERALEMEIKKQAPARPTPEAKKSGQFSGFPGLSLSVERYLLFLLMHDPALFKTVNEVLARVQLKPLESEDFGQPEHRQILAMLLDKKEHGEPFQIEELDLSAEPLWGNLYQEWREFLGHIASLPETDLALAAGRCALQLRKLRLEQRLVELQYLNEDAQRDNDSEAMKRWGELVLQCSHEEGRLDEALSKVTVLGYKYKEESPLL